MLSGEAQTDYMNVAFSMPVIPDIKLNSLLASVEMDHLLSSYRFDLAAQHRESLLERLREAAAGNGGAQRTSTTPDGE